MAPHDSQPWNPDRAWADPFIALLLVVVLALGNGVLRGSQARAQAPDVQATLQGRLQDAVLGGSKALEASNPLPGLRLPLPSGAGLAEGARSGWDQAILAVHAGEARDFQAGARLARGAPGPAGAAFLQAWTWAYQGTGAAPAPEALRPVLTALGDGYASRILEARLLARAGGDPGPLEQRARAGAVRRLLALGLAGLAGLLLAGTGLAFGLVQALTPGSRPPLPRFSLSGRAVLVVVLGWFLTFLVAGTAVALLIRPLPGLKPFYLPMVYGLHAALGVGYLCRAEAIGPGELWRRVAPGRTGAALAAGLGYFTLAFAAVLAVALLLGPVLGGHEPPQRQLFDLLAGLKGRGAVVVMFLTVAGVAPVFEELMFRGFLLPWLGERLQAWNPRRGWPLAVAITGLGFGAMHLQPLGLPTLTTLGLVLGFAFVRTGNLVTTILVHGLWNGGVFLLLRML